jgi:2-deoxy-D-gluconate 3-dehydrogenase
MMIIDRFDLTGKTALVTGCRRGIGRGFAQALAEAGADIVGVGSKLETSGSEVEMDVRKTGREFKGYSCDFSNRQDLSKFIRDVKRDIQQIDILVNNAGIVLRKPAVEHPDEYWDKVIEVNLRTQFVLAREFGKDMLERGHGKIIFTASMLTFQGGITVPGYAASKSGIGGLTKALANEWAAKGVNVNAIAPGWITTDFIKSIQDDPVRHEFILSRIPAGRWGTPDDLKGAIVFLSSDASDYVHGTIIVVDGGWMGR